MTIFRVAFTYLRRHPALSLGALASIMLASLFEGVSFGMVIPLLQGMTNAKTNILEKIPFIQQFPVFSHSTDQTAFVTLVFIALFLALVVKNIFTYQSNVLISKLRFTISADLSIALVDNLIDYDLRFFDNAKTGMLVSTITTETRRIGDFVLSMLTLTSLLAKVIAYITLLFLVSWKSSLFIVVLIIIVLAPLERIMKKVKKIGASISRASADYHFKLMEILSGIRLIKGCGAEDLEKRKFESVAHEMSGLQYKASSYSYSLIPLSEVSIFGLIMIFFFVLVHTIKIEITNAFPFIAAYLMVLVKTLTQLNLINTMRSNAINNLAAFAEYEQLCDPRGKNTIGTGAISLGNFSDRIEFREVDFSYTDNKKVLRGISVTIPRGKITALVGASGAGKTTLVNLVMRYYDVTAGRILVDGFDLKDLDLRGWRRRIGFVSQDVFIFNMSVKDNIAYGCDGVEADRIIDIAKTANAHEFIMHLPHQYDTILGERGSRLSGGQKQRISIARAMFHNPEILILDEATSSLDTETERLIAEAMDRLTKDRTVIAIAHRLSTVSHADNIIVLEGGRVVDDGRHGDLIKKNGLYKRLYEAQFSA